MKIVIDHLTRMSSGFICAAGIDPETGLHIRPVLRGKQRFEVARLTSHGGPLAIGAIMDFKGAVPTPVRPEIEDYLVFQLLMRRVGSMDNDRFWEMLVDQSKTRLAGIFGSDLLHDGRSCTMMPGSGLVSLGLLSPAHPPQLQITQRLNGRSSVRMRVTDGEVSCNLSVTDVRLYSEDDRGSWVPNSPVTQCVSAQLGKGDPVVLAVGLTRPYAGADGQPRHWLQINNIHFQDSSVFVEL